MADTTYISVKEAAEKWELTPRRVQQMCKEGQIPVAERRGREWLIPKGAKKPEAAATPPKRAPVRPRPAVRQGPFMPLTASAFPLGQAREYISQFPEEDQPLALAEYFYFSGQAEQAAAITEPCLDHHDLKKKLTACLIYGFASLSLGRIRSARFALGSIKRR